MAVPRSVTLLAFSARPSTLHCYEHWNHHPALKWNSAMFRNMKCTPKTFLRTSDAVSEWVLATSTRRFTSLFLMTIKLHTLSSTQGQQSVPPHQPVTHSNGRMNVIYSRIQLSFSMQFTSTRTGLNWPRKDQNGGNLSWRWQTLCIILRSRCVWSAVYTDRRGVGRDKWKVNRSDKRVTKFWMPSTLCNHQSQYYDNEAF